MKNTAWLFLLLFAILVCGGCAKRTAIKPANTETPIMEYSALVTFHSDKPAPDEKALLYVKGGKRKTEAVSTHKFIRIENRDTSTSMMIIPSRKKCLEYRGVPMQIESLEMYGKRVESGGKLVGQELVNGYTCDKYVRKGDGLTGKVWISRDLNIPIKCEIRYNSKVLLETDVCKPPFVTLNIKRPETVISYDLTNIRVGNVQDSCFESPREYKHEVKGVGLTASAVIP